MIKRFLVLPHLVIHNANALSSPFTIGFPAMTAWLGFVHALQRKLNITGYSSLQFVATSVISHQCDLQTYKGPGDYVHSIVGTGNPLDKKGKRPSFIEEARCHLDVSLLIEYKADEETQDIINLPNSTSQFMAHVEKQLGRMKIAGGDLLKFDTPISQILNSNDKGAQKKLMCSLMPGFALIERRELMKSSMEQGNDVLQAMLEYLTIHHKCTITEKGDIKWVSERKRYDQENKSGWIIPIAIGFQGISPLGIAKNQRDPDTPHRFAESIITLGEFQMVHKIDQIDKALWCYHTNLDKNLYLCQQAPLEQDGFPNI
jgi:CRISPR-associated protein Csy2